MEYKIITSSSPDSLTREVIGYINEGWKLSGSHKVVVIHSQNRFSGSQHMDTRHQTEYSQTITKE